MQQDPNDIQSLHASRLEQLLAAPRHDSYFRNTVFQSVTRLEHHHRELSLRAWIFLNQPSSDSGISNLLVFSRRNQLALPALDTIEGADSMLERALHLWGELKLDECDSLLAIGEKKYATDTRFKNNRLWLSMTAPVQLAATANTRELCQAVLAFKTPLH
ncbi:MAG: hypothetical protein ACI84O_001642 [Myxococcota bacterium]|jgi:hypothetical protein